jgi:hypothetical protein
MVTLLSRVTPGAPFVGTVEVTVILGVPPAREMLGIRNTAKSKSRNKPGRAIPFDGFKYLALLVYICCVRSSCAMRTP